MKAQPDILDSHFLVARALITNNESIFNLASRGQ